MRRRLLWFWPLVLAIPVAIGVVIHTNQSTDRSGGGGWLVTGLFSYTIYYFVLTWPVWLMRMWTSRCAWHPSTCGSCPGMPAARPSVPGHGFRDRLAAEGEPLSSPSRARDEGCARPAGYGEPAEVSGSSSVAMAP